MNNMTHVSRADLARLGYQVVLEGGLEDLRKKVGLSRNAQAALIGVEGDSLAKWERLERAMNLDTAVRVGEWYWGANQVLATAQAIDFKEMVPSSRAAQHLGIAGENIEQYVRDHKVKHEVLGVLGMFIYRTGIS